jgi:hypothetical protein
MNEKLQGAIACSAFVFGLYLTYIWGNIVCGNGMPDGPLFAGVLTVIGAIFGYKFGPTVEKALKAAKKP